MQISGIDRRIPKILLASCECRSSRAAKHRVRHRQCEEGLSEHSGAARRLVRRLTPWPNGNDPTNVPHSRDTGETVATWAGTPVKIAASPEFGLPYHAFLDVGAEAYHE
jgi:hypothetical protein